MSETVFKIVLTLHVAAGAIALLSGICASLADKRRGWHTRLGTIFGWAMLLVTVTAFPVTLYRDNVFLRLIALFSFHMVYSGWRSARVKGSRATAPLDWVVYVGALCWSAYFIYYGVNLVMVLKNNFGIVSIVFGIIGLRAAYSDLKALAGNSQRPWIYNHIQMMGGALVAAFTAFLTVNADRFFPFAPPIAVWLLPTVIGTPIISYAIAKRVRRNRT